MELEYFYNCQAQSANTCSFLNTKIPIAAIGMKLEVQGSSQVGQCARETKGLGKTNSCGCSKLQHRLKISSRLATVQYFVAPVPL